MSTNETNKNPEDGQTAPVTIGDKVRFLRKSRNMTLAALSRASGL